MPYQSCIQKVTIKVFILYYTECCVSGWSMTNIVGNMDVAMETQQLGNFVGKTETINKKS